MITIEQSTTIKRPVEAVWKFMTNVENATQWDRGVLGARLTSEGAPGVGSTVETRRRFFGRERIGRLTVSEWQPAKTLAFQIKLGQATASQRYTFTALENGTRLTQTAELNFVGWWKLAAPMMVRMLKRDGLEDLANIKRILEMSA